jgi:citrate lyase subunit alpha / citrate CoA-transferase
VTTLCAPGEMIDVVVTERGVAINPRRPDLREAVAGAGVPLCALAELKATAERICGGAPTPPELGDRLVGVVQWVDGTLLDSIYAVEGGA